jgi:hypothetical protein
MSSHQHHPHHVGHEVEPSSVALWIALLLGTVALVSGLTAWRAAVHSGHATTAFTLSTQQAGQASALEQEVTQSTVTQRTLFLAYAADQQHGDTAGMATVRGLMDGPTQATIDWWEHQPPATRPLSPFSAANPDWTTPRQAVDARDAQDASLASLDEAEHQLGRSHELELLVALLALAFLTAGLTSTLRSNVAQWGLLGISAVVLLGSTIVLGFLW